LDKASELAEVGLNSIAEYSVLSWDMDSVLLCVYGPDMVLGLWHCQTSQLAISVVSGALLQRQSALFQHWIATLALLLLSWQL
jgi:hypothetical protein